MMRPLVYDFQEDSNVINLEDEYLFGNSMLVAPIMEENQTSRKVYLPEGQCLISLQISAMKEKNG